MFIKLTPEEIKAFDGLEEANRKMCEEFNKKAPMCHMRKMEISEDDSQPYPNIFWECSYCGHTKELSHGRKEKGGAK